LEGRLEIEGNCMFGGDGAFAKHRLNDIESMFLGIGSGKLVGDSSSGSSDMLIHFFRGSVVVQRIEKLGVGAKVVGEANEGGRGKGPSRRGCRKCLLQLAFLVFRPG
jgi:hypothetical protein